MAYTANTNFDQYLSTTLNNHRANLIDNVFDARVLAFFLKDNGSVKISGGQKIVRPVLGQKNSSPAFYDPTSDSLTTATDVGPTAAEWAWKAHSGNVKIWGIEEARNMGEAQIIDLVSTRVQVLEESIIDDWNDAFWAASPGANDFHSIPELLDTNLTGDTVAVGNIDPSIAGNEWWQSDVTAVGGAGAFADLQNTYHSVSIGNDVPTVIITTQALFEDYEASLTDQVRYEDVNTANAGFQSLMFKGTPIVYDADCPANAMYMLNTKYIEFVVHQERFLEPTPFVRPYDQDYRIAHIVTYGNLTCTSRRKQGVLTGMTSYA